MSGFPDKPVYEVGDRTDDDTVLTHLIPGMNFTHSAIIAGFIVAGRMFNQDPHSKIQIWRENSSQPGAYYRVQPDIIVDRSEICALSARVVSQVLECILDDDYRVSVEPGDFLGLELPRAEEDSEIYFTIGGPNNFIFEGHLNSRVISNLSNSDFKEIQQRPQIVFNLTLGIAMLLTVCD